MPASNFEHDLLNDISFMVIDFEGFTRKDHPIEPVEVGAMRIVPPGVVDIGFEVDELICPPAEIPFPPFFTVNTGIRAQDVVGKPGAEIVLARLDRYFENAPHVIVAHNAHVEARVLLRYAHQCPHIATMPFIDTLALARFLLPQLSSHTLNAVANYYKLPLPVNRHRALADVRLTCEVFLQLLEMWREKNRDQSFYLLRRVAGINTNPTPTQPSLFE